jgi:hypothetical protein
MFTSFSVGDERAGDSSKREDLVRFDGCDLTGLEIKADCEHGPASLLNKPVDRDGAKL